MSKPNLRGLLRLVLAQRSLHVASATCAFCAACSGDPPAAASADMSSAVQQTHDGMDAGSAVVRADTSTPTSGPEKNATMSTQAPRASAAGAMVAAAGDGRAPGAPRAGAMAVDASVAAASQAGSGGVGVAEPNAAGEAGAAMSTQPNAVCSGCSSERLTTMDMTLHLHHVHMNVASRERSQTFYETHLAAERITLNGVSDALHAAPVLLLADETTEPIRSALPTAFQHIGWGSSDPAAWYAQAHSAGVSPDTRGHTLFNTDDMPTVGGPGSGATNFTLLGVQPPACYPVPDVFSYMYVLGPDLERIEVWSGIDMRVNHLHFTTPDLAATVGWYRRFLGLPMEGEPALFSAFFVDDILFFFEADGSAADYHPSDGHVMSHVAFSVTDLDAWLARAASMDVEVVAPPAETNGFTSAFVRGPDGLLIELVRAEPLQEFCP